MNRRTALLFPVALLASTPALAQPSVFTPQDDAAIRAVIDGYFAAITVKDYPTIEKLAHAPYVVWGPEFRTLPTMTEVMARYRQTGDSLNLPDYKLSRAIEVRVEPLHGRVAMAHVHWERLKKDGSRLNEGAEVLVMSKVDDDWKISGNFGEALREFRGK
jgi:hypothetical protein